MEKLEELPHYGLHLVPVDDGIHEAVLDKELGTLEALGEFLADGLLDDPGPGESDHGARLGQVDVAQHAEGGRHPPAVGSVRTEI